MSQVFAGFTMANSTSAYDLTNDVNGLRGRGYSLVLVTILMTLPAVCLVINRLYLRLAPNPGLFYYDDIAILISSVSNPVLVQEKFCNSSIDFYLADVQYRHGRL